MKPVSIYPLAGIDNASGRDDALQVRGKAPHNFLRDAVNVDISTLPAFRISTPSPSCGRTGFGVFLVDFLGIF